MLTRQTVADRRTGTVVGVLFIVATSFLFLGEMFYKPYLDAPDALVLIDGNKPRIVFGLMIELVCILAMPLIGAFIYPVLSRVSVGMALGYFFFRSLEAVVLIAVALTNKLTLISLSAAHVAAGDATDLLKSVALIRAQNIWGDTGGILYVIIFACGGLFLYTVMLRATLIPRWMAGWGLIAVVMIGAAAVSAIFVTLPPFWEVALIIPIALQEMVMALWLIFKGFDLSRVARQP